MIQKWGEELNDREDDVKKSRQGKIDAATHSQTVTFMKPLMRSLKNKVRSLLIFISLGTQASIEKSCNI